MKHMTNLAVAAALAAGPALADGHIPATEFNVVGSIGILSMYTQMEQPFWNETIVSSTGGAIQANLRPFNELGFGGGELFSLVSNGTVQMAHQVLSYTSGAVPLNESTDLVGVAATVEEVQEAADAFRDAHAAYLAEEHGIKLLGYGTYQAQVTYCAEPFETLADLAGRQVRASGASQQVFLEHLGASPIGMAFGEVPAALANGTIDCAITGALSGYLAGWHEAANYISAQPVNYGTIAAIANMDWWNTLDPAAQAAIEDGLATLEGEMFALASTETADGLACNTDGPCSYGDNGGMTLVPVSEDDAALVREAALTAVLPAFRERCGDDCASIWNETIGITLGFEIE